MRKSVAELQQPALKKQLEEEILPTYLPKRRWFGAKDAVLPKLEVNCQPAFPESPYPVVLCEIKLAGSGERYQLPLTILWEDDIVSALPQQLALARVRIGRRVGLVTDAFALDTFPLMLLAHLKKESVLERGAETTEFIPTVLLKEYEIAEEKPQVRSLAAEQSNSTVVIDDKVIIKLLRRGRRRHPSGGGDRPIPRRARLSQQLAGFGRDPPRLTRRRAADAGCGAGLPAQPRRRMELGPGISCPRAGRRSVGDATGRRRRDRQRVDGAV